MRPDAEQKFVRIALLENIFEAQLVSSVLNQQGIAHRIRSFYDTAYDGLFQLQKGWGKLSAPLSCKQEILAILENIRSNG